jgi:beta-lactamase superfamily II metal-dependent hydrolase
MKKAAALALAGVALVAALASAQGRMSRTLDIYLIDVEGGNATLFVTPSGESMLIDTGNSGAAATRDADRIMAAITNAGVRQIDHLITTHYHGDHFGAMAELAARIPIRNFIDHGRNVQPTAATDAFLEKVYPTLYAKSRHTVVRPGDRVSMGDVNVRVVTSAGQSITSSLPGAGRQNPYCASFVPQAADPTENAQSVGVHLTFGRFRVLHLGDLTVDKEFDLMCPANRLGDVDVFVVSHHGQPTSNSEVLVHAIQPRVALLNNGTRKGGQPDAMKVLFSAPRLEDIWQLHFSLLSGQEYTVPGMFIANHVDEPQPAMPIAPAAAPAPGAGAPPPPIHNGPAFWIKVTARDDGAFTVVNARNSFAKTYAVPLAAR